MASVRVIGPLGFDFGPDGLSPGESVPTVWTIDPPPGSGTVTFTAHPFDYYPIGNNDGARLAIRDPTIQVQLDATGNPAVTLHAVVANVGQYKVNIATMYISIIEPPPPYLNPHTPPLNPTTI